MGEVRRPLEDYLAMEYPFMVHADPDGGYVIVFPDLPGCMTQVDDATDIGPMAEDARKGWIETCYELGREIPLPSYTEEYSGRFVVRMPKSLHRDLAEQADRNDVSLNTWIIYLLSGNLVKEAGRRPGKAPTRGRVRDSERPKAVNA